MDESSATVEEQANKTREVNACLLGCKGLEVKVLCGRSELCWLAIMCVWGLRPGMIDPMVRLPAQPKFHGHWAEKGDRWLEHGGVSVV